jgi:hypothetical protein
MNPVWDLNFFNLSNSNNYDFIKGKFTAPGRNGPVINTRISPTLQYNDNISPAVSIRIKGDAGIDTNNDGTLDNTSYPTGYRAFYVYKYEMSEQQYADFLNTLTSNQINTLGVAGSTITLTAGQYFPSSPNRACGNANAARVLAYADWSGLRPLSFLEFNKCSYGPFRPTERNGGYPAFDFDYEWDLLRRGEVNGDNNLLDVTRFSSSTLADSARQRGVASYYGVILLTGNAIEPVVRLNDFTFNIINGNGQISTVGTKDIPTWSDSMIIFIDQLEHPQYNNSKRRGFRFARSVE